MSRSFLFKNNHDWYIFRECVTFFYELAYFSYSDYVVNSGRPFETEAAEQLDEFIADSTQALHFHLAQPSSADGTWTMPQVDPEDDSEDEQQESNDESKWFHGDFTYPIYGEEEKIYGFSALQMRMCFTPASMRPLIDISFDQQKKNTNVHKDVLLPLLKTCFAAPSDEGEEPEIPEDGTVWTSKAAVFDKWLKEDVDFKPCGEKVFEFENNDSVFEVYRSTFATPRFKQFHRRIQPFVLFMIEGGSFIEEDDERWEMFCIYERGDADQIKYRFVGYTTCYSYFLYPDRIRKRISQFIVLPPYQNRGIGGTVYRFLYLRFRDDPLIVDITVEDPTEGFADMRTRSDLRLLLKDNAFEHGKIISTDDIENVRTKYKFSKQQSVLLAELYRLYKLNPKYKLEMKEYRVWVKKRIYRKNEEALSGEDSYAVKDKLEQTFQNVLEDYQRILQGVKV